MFTVKDGEAVFEFDGTWPWTIRKLKNEVEYHSEAESKNDFSLTTKRNN